MTMTVPLREGKCLVKYLRAVFQVPVEYQWLARIEALAAATAMFMALALSHHVTYTCGVVIGRSAIRHGRASTIFGLT